MADSGPSFIQMPADAQGLVGATPQSLSAAFGHPAILRVEGTAQVWLYHESGCGLNLVLYPDAAGTPRVAMAAPTDAGGNAAACSAALARDHLAGLDQPVAESQAPAPLAPPPASIPAALPVVAPPGASEAGSRLDGPGAAGLERPSSS
jgi:hypothetical protein